jgi:hypothetical protein
MFTTILKKKLVTKRKRTKPWCPDNRKIRIRQVLMCKTAAWSVAAHASTCKSAADGGVDPAAKVARDLTFLYFGSCCRPSRCYLSRSTTHGRLPGVLTALSSCQSAEIWQPRYGTTACVPILHCFYAHLFDRPHKFLVQGLFF